ncbi:hypothetical protein C7E25_08620, partial [Stenotrophomonas maltophilia]
MGCPDGAGAASVGSMRARPVQKFGKDTGVFGWRRARHRGAAWPLGWGSLWVGARARWLRRRRWPQAAMAWPPGW